MCQSPCLWPFDIWAKKFGHSCQLVVVILLIKRELRIPAAFANKTKMATPTFLAYWFAQAYTIQILDISALPRGSNYDENIIPPTDKKSSVNWDTNRSKFINISIKVDPVGGIGCHFVCSLTLVPAVR